MRTMFVLLLVSVSLGCVTTVGPFVSNVQTGPNRTLIVERCLIRYQSFVNEISRGQCSSETLAAP